MDPNQRKMDNIENVRNIVELVIGGSIMNPLRKRESVEARMVFSCILKDMGYSLSSIGRVLGKHHTTVIHYIRSLDDLVETNSFFLKKYLKCKEILLLGQSEVSVEDNTSVLDAFIGLTNQIELLKSELNIARIEKEDIIKEYSIRNDKRLNKIFKVIENNTKVGDEFMTERKIRYLFEA